MDRFFGAVMGRKAQADSLFAAIEARYDEAAQRVDTVTTRPVVFFGSTWQGRFMPLRGTAIWCAPCVMPAAHRGRRTPC